MTERKKVVVKINGQDFTVIGNESEEYIRHIAKFVDEKISEVQSKNKKLTQSMASILTAFNIADLYYKSYIELTDLKEEIKEPLHEFEILKVKTENYEKEKNILEEERLEYKEELLSLKKEIDKKDSKIRRYEQALKLKENEIQKSEKIISELQNKLFENQLELVQTKKELEEFLKSLDEE